jgi:CheY-like chemotaxis protein
MKGAGQMAPGPTRSPRPRRLLLVDDEANDRGGLKDLLAGSPWDVLEASSCREALAILDRQPVNLVLLDAGLKGMDCVEMLDAVRQRIRDLPVVVMGAAMTPKLCRRWRSRGAMDCLAKPVDSRILSALLFACAPPSGFADS